MSLTTITKLGTAPAGDGTAVAITPLDDEVSPSAGGSPATAPNLRFATAVRNKSNNMDVTVWESTAAGPALVCANSTGFADDIAVAGLSSSTLVTTLKDGNGNLRLIPWRIVPDGSGGENLERGKDSPAGGITGATAVVALTSSRLVTAFRSASGDLALKAYDYNYTTGALTNVGNNSETGEIDEDANIGIVRISDTQLVTAVKNSEGNLQIIVFNVAANGSVTRKGSAVGSVYGSAMALNSLGGTRIAASIGDPKDANNLRIDIWDVDPNGNLHRKGYWSDSPIALVAGGDTRTNVFPTAVQAQGGTLKIMAWDVTFGISKVAESIPSDAVTGLAAATLLPTSESTTFATALRLSNDVLQVVTYGIESDIHAYDPKTQSPKPLVTNQATEKKDPTAMPVFAGTFSSATVDKTVHEQDGHETVVDVALLIPWDDTTPAANQVTLEIGKPDSTGTPQPTKYRVLQVHMHRHSEHTINGTEYPLEMHCVLTDPVPDSNGKRPAPTAVLGFLIDDTSPANNEGLNFYLDNLDQPEGANVTFGAQNLNLLLPGDKTYLSYHGSLTSPSQTDWPLNATPILWYVLRNFISVSNEQFATYAAAVAEHCRILQTGNDSKVWLISQQS